MLINKENVRFNRVKLLTDYKTGIAFIRFYDLRDSKEKDRLLTKAEAKHLAELIDKGSDEFALDWFVHGVY
jgi:hypothetical protein